MQLMHIPKRENKTTDNSKLTHPQERMQRRHLKKKNPLGEREEKE